MPENIKELINAWCNQQSAGYDLCTLPCAILSSPESLCQSRSSERPVTWMHTNGDIVKVARYSFEKSKNN
jgi:hypothetical protein